MSCRLAHRWPPRAPAVTSGGRAGGARSSGAPERVGLVLTVSETSRRVHRVAHALSATCGLRIEARYEGPLRSGGRYGGWCLEWTAGPSRPQLQRLLDAAAEDAGLDVAALRLRRRRGSDRHTAAALLAWLAQHPDRGDQLAGLGDDELPEYPERLPDVFQTRAATLVAHGWQPRPSCALHRALLRHARSGGAAAVTAWLAELSAECDRTVVDLAARRGG